VSFLGELKRRNVFRVAGVYAVVGWLLVQVAASLEEAVGLPAWFDGLVVSLLLVFFPIALIFAWAFELTPEGIKRTSAVAPEESITDRTANKLDLVLVLALLVFSAAIIAPRFLDKSIGADPVATSGAQGASEMGPAVDGSDSGESVSGRGAVPAASIAVMPFIDLSPNGDQEYFADGISEELLNVLAKVEALKVAGRTSSFAFKGRNEDLTEIGRVLKVAHILEGSVRSQGDRVRVTAQLIQVGDGYHLWSETYDGNLSDIFAVQDDIARQILAAMTEQLLVDGDPEVAPTTRTDVTAYGLFLEARDLIFTRDVAKMRRAMALLDQVIAIDPSYAPAYALRGKAYLLLSDSSSSYGDIPVQEAYEMAEADVNKALTLDPQLADAHAVRGLLNNDRGNPDFALASLRKALKLSPNMLDARNWLAFTLTDSGRIREALDELAILRDIDPLFSPAVNNAVVYAEELNDRDRAVAIARDFIGLTPDPVAGLDYKARIATLQGRTADAIGLWNQIPEVDRTRPILTRMEFSYLRLGEPPWLHGIQDMGLSQRAFARAWLGDRARALELADEALAEAPDQVSTQRNFLFVLSRLGEHRRLLDYFESKFAGDLNIYATRLRSSAFTLTPPFEAIARAARATGEDELFASAMRRWRESIDSFRAGGSAASNRDEEDARYWALMGDAEQSLDFLESAVEKRIVPFADVYSDPAFEFMALNPRFVALRNESARRINDQRLALGWEPLPERVFIDGFGSGGP
jgi:TolB-like protein/tetratricopeptide (TPR) repeat protein